jgi:hypothetical protein
MVSTTSLLSKAKAILEFDSKEPPELILTVIKAGEEFDEHKEHLETVQFNTTSSLPYFVGGTHQKKIAEGDILLTIQQ